MKTILKRLWIDQEGQDLTEYALLVVLIALAAITGMKAWLLRSAAYSLAAGTNMTAAS